MSALNIPLGSFILKTYLLTFSNTCPNTISPFLSFSDAFFLGTLGADKCRPPLEE